MENTNIATVILKVETNIDEVTEKAGRLVELLKEANSLANEIASSGIDLEVKV